MDMSGKSLRSWVEPMVIDMTTKNEANLKKRELAGRCQCGAVSYAVADEFAYAANCHCSDCRRMTGAAFKSFAGIEVSKFRVVSGRESIKRIGDGSYDARCDRCGSFLFSVVRDGMFVHVNMGTLADTPTIRPREHIFVRSKAPWFTITDDLPQYWTHIADGPPINC
jgi:hypothetical protein